MRIAFCLAALLSWPESALASTTFDFDDYPDSSGCHAPVALITCQEYLDLVRIGMLGHGEFAIPVFTTVDGIRLDLSTVGDSGFGWDAGVIASQGNFLYSAPFVAQFSFPLSSAQIDIRVLQHSQTTIEWIEPVLRLEAFDAQGTMIASHAEPAIVDQYATLSVSAPSGLSIRTIRFSGGGLGKMPEEGEEPIDILNNCEADNLEVERTVPEPGAATLLLVGAASLRAARRHRLTSRNRTQLHLALTLRL
jgi:hypothetical protein